MDSDNLPDVSYLEMPENVNLLTTFHMTTLALSYESYFRLIDRYELILNYNYP